MAQIPLNYERRRGKSRILQSTTFAVVTEDKSTIRKVLFREAHMSVLLTIKQTYSIAVFLIFIDCS